MLFRRKNDESPEELREQYRGSNHTAETPLRATFEAPDLTPVEGEIADLTIQGAGVRIPFERDPELKDGELVELAIHSDIEQWAVRTPVQICQVSKDGYRHVVYGCQFVNMGNLYAQLDDSLGKHFNRRKGVRISPALDQRLLVSLGSKHHRIRGLIYDMSAAGLGVIVDHVQAAMYSVGTELLVRFALPGVPTEVEGRAVIRHRYRLSTEDFVGLEFDPNDQQFQLSAEPLAEYVQERAERLERLHKAR